MDGFDAPLPADQDNGETLERGSSRGVSTSRARGSDVEWAQAACCDLQALIQSLANEAATATSPTQPSTSSLASDQCLDRQHTGVSTAQMYDSYCRCSRCSCPVRCVCAPWPRLDPQATGSGPRPPQEARTVQLYRRRRIFGGQLHCSHARSDVRTAGSITI